MTDQTHFENIIERYRSLAEPWDLLVADFGGFEASLIQALRSAGELVPSASTISKMGMSVWYEKLRFAKTLTQDNVPHQEIARTVRLRPDTLAQWFPGTQWAKGGTPQSQEIRHANRQLRRLSTKPKGIPMQRELE